MGKGCSARNKSNPRYRKKEGNGNFVTEYDRENQEYLRETLLRLRPNAVFVGEEDAHRVRVDQGEVFVVDPIDGTLNFIRHYGRSAVSIALLHDGEPVLGVVYDPYLDELFSAVKGAGAALNGRSIRVSRRPLHEGLPA